MIHKTNAQVTYDENEIELRTKDNYQQHVSLDKPNKTGVKEDSCLNKLRYFHVTENMCGYHA